MSKTGKIGADFSVETGPSKDIPTWDAKYAAASDAALMQFMEYPSDSFAILQLKQTEDNVKYDFMGYNWLQNQGEKPDFSRYAVVYTDILPENHTLEDLYQDFNRDDRPNGQTSHAMSTRDIVLLKQQQEITAHYCDMVGFQKLEGFMPEDWLTEKNYLRNAEMAMEDDYDSIDGIINNGPKKESGPHFEEKDSVLDKLQESKAEAERILTDRTRKPEERVLE